MPAIKLGRDKFFRYAQGALVGSKTALDYLNKRRVTGKQVREFNIGYSGRGLKFEDGDNSFFAPPNHLIFPLIDEYGRLVGIQTRAASDEVAKNDRYRKKMFIRNTGYLYGVNVAIESMYKSKTVMIVEGIFDVLAMQSHFPPVVGYLKGGLGKLQQEVLDRYIINLIDASDNDETGKEFSNNLKKWSSKRYSLTQLDYPGDDPSSWKMNNRDRCVEYLTDLKDIFFSF